MFFCFFFVRWQSSHRIDPLSVRLSRNVNLHIKLANFAIFHNKQVLRITGDRYKNSEGSLLRNFLALWDKNFLKFFDKIFWNFLTKIVIPPRRYIYLKPNVSSIYWRVPPTKVFGTARRKFFETFWQKFFEIFWQISWYPPYTYLSKTQFFFNILKGPPYKIFRHRNGGFFSNISRMRLSGQTRKYEVFS